MLKKHKRNIAKIIFKSWDKHTEMWCRIVFILMIPAALNRMFATICIIFGFILLSIIRTGYEKYWHLDDADKKTEIVIKGLIKALEKDDLVQDKSNKIVPPNKKPAK